MNSYFLSNLLKNNHPDNVSKCEPGWQYFKYSVNNSVCKQLFSYHYLYFSIFFSCLFTYHYYKISDNEACYSVSSTTLFFWKHGALNLLYSGKQYLSLFRPSYLRKKLPVAQKHAVFLEFSLLYRVERRRKPLIIDD